MKLIMTLLVRDEEDILEENIRFHLNSGVDYIVATDNGSKDGTIDILEKYKKKKLLDYRIENKHTYEQDKWVSMMAEKAVSVYKADFLMHCDADEFWVPKIGSLKDSLVGMKDVLHVPVVNYLPPIDLDINGFNFNNFHFVVNKTKECPVLLKG